MEDAGWNGLSIGKKIHLYRMHASLNIETLAKLSGVSPSYISKVESDKSIPSIDVIENLSSAFKTTASKLLAYPPFSHSLTTPAHDGPSNREKLAPFVVRKNARKKIRPPKANVDYELLTPDLQRDLEFVMVVHPPGETTEPFSHVGEESLLCLSGTICVVIREEKFILQEGDTLSFNCSVPHHVSNDSEEDATVIIASTPASF